MIKRDVVKHLKTMATADVQKKIEQGRRMNKWLQQIYLNNVILIIWKKFKKSRHSEYVLSKMHMIVRNACFALRIKRKIKMKADTTLRLTHSVKRSLNFKAMIKYD